jgi:hypothetical protein
VVAVAVDGGELLAEAGGLLQHLVTIDTDLEILLAEDADRRIFARCGLRTVPLHRLGLRHPLPDGVDGDLLAALSEIIGFDPGPGLGILAPGELADRPDRTAVGQAAATAAHVYGAEIVRSLPAGGIPYRLDRAEAAHKRYALGPAASPVESFAVAIPRQRAG